MALCSCPEDHLCDRCYRRELETKRGQADAIGQCWAERICRGEHRRREAWPEHEQATIEMALRKVVKLSQDPRLLAALAKACSAGAAAWWQRRPARYR